MISDYYESHEDYLKAIYLISKKKRGGWVSNSEIAELLKVKPPSVTDMLYKLRDEGFINWQPRKSIRLTPKGKQIAKNIIKKNLELKRFFRSIGITDESELEELCCKIEHHITPEVRIALENLNLDQ